MKKQKNILICGPYYPFRDSENPKELKTCNRCKCKVKLSDDWSDKKIHEIICSDCAKELKPKKIRLLERTVDSVNKKLGTNYTKEELLKKAKEKLEEKESLIAG